MKRIWILTLAIFFFFGVTPMAVFSADPAKAMAVDNVGGSEATVPVAVLAEPRYTFSDVVDGTEVVHDFILKNAGTAPLAVQKVKTS